MDIQKYIDRLDEDRRDMEERLRDEQKASEQRRIEERKEFRKEMSDMRSEMREGFKDLGSRITKIEDKVESKMDNLYARMDSLKWWIISVCLATIIGIAAMVITIVVTPFS